MINRRHFFCIYFLIIAAGLYLNLHQDLVVPMKKSFSEFPTSLSQWHMAGESSLSSEVQNVLKASDVLLREYVDTQGDKVNLYIGYHSGGKDSGEIHSPKHCLPGSGWFELSSRQTRLNAAGKELNLVSAVYQKGESKELFLYWFQVGDESLSDEYSLKLAGIFNSMVHRRRDAAFIRVSVPIHSDEQKALVVGERFVRDFLPAIEAHLPG